MRKLAIDCRMHNCSGIGTVIRNIVPYLIKHFSCTLIFNKDNIFPFEGSYKTIFFKSYIYSVKEQVEYYTKVKDVDLFWSPHYNFPLLLRGGIKRVTTIHDVFHLDNPGQLSKMQVLYAKLFLTLFIKGHKTIITDSEFSGDRICFHSRLSPEKVSVIYLGIDTRLFQPSGQKNLQLPDKYILYVGNVKPHKNLKTLLLAYSLLKESVKEEYAVVIVGKKEGFLNEDKEIDLLVNRYNLLRYIHFTGYVPDKALQELYSRASLFVFPSLYEGFGLPPLEAMACGVPVILSNAASLPEVCGNGALYVDPKDSTDLSKKINLVLTDTTLQEQLKVEGHKQVKRYKWEDTAKKYIDVFNQI